VAKFLIAPDLHTTETGPSSRSDDVLRTQIKVLSHYALKYPDIPLLLPGDVLDKRRQGNTALVRLGKLIRKRKGKTVAVPGQHDLRGHNLDTYCTESDLAVLEGLVGNLKVLGDGESITLDGVKITGYPWGSKAWDDLVEGRTSHSGIGIVHASVCDSAWPEALDITKTHIKGTGWLFFGDIHKGFLPTRPKGNKNIMCAGGGVLTPMKKNEMAFSCNFFLLDTTAKSIKVLPIPWEDYGVAFHEDVDDYAVSSYVSSHFIEQLKEIPESAVKDPTDMGKFLKSLAKELGIGKSAVTKLLSEIPDGQ